MSSIYIRINNQKADNINLEDILDWPGDLTPTMRSNIRNIEFYGQFLPSIDEWMDGIHAELSGKARVVYISIFTYQIPQVLQHIPDTYSTQTQHKVPQYHAERRQMLPNGLYRAPDEELTLKPENGTTI